MAGRNATSHDPAKSTRATIRAVVFFSVILTVVFFFSFFFSEEGIAELRNAQRRVTELEAEIERLEAENERLKKVLEDVRSSTFQVERIAREDLGMSRPGETVYILPDEPGAEQDGGS